MKSKSITIQFAKILMRFDFPSPIEIPKEFLPFLYEGTEHVQIQFKIELLRTPLIVEESMIGHYNGINYYPFKEGILREYSTLREKDGCQVACYLNKRGENVLYYPEGKWDFYSKEFRCLHLIGIESILIERQSFLLHSSVVEVNGKMILFAGSSGVGKSTQAEKWREYLHAKVINGDRCIVRKMDDNFYGCGSPWAGTSKIYDSSIAPIAGIFLLKKGKENKMRSLKGEAFSKLYRNTICNIWDKDFVEKISELIRDVAITIPVYELECMLDEKAVMMAYQALKEGGRL